MPFRPLGRTRGRCHGALFVVAAPLVLWCGLLIRDSVARAGGRAVDGVLNLNTAPVELLTLLPGIGPAKARAILSYRARRPFRTVDELVRVKGIGRRMVREMRAHLAIVGPSTARGGAGAAWSEPVPAPRPVVSNASSRLACRPTVVVAPRFVPARTRDSRQLSSVRSPANHCAPHS